MMEAAILVLSSLTHQAVCMGVEIDAVAEGLDAGHNPRHKLFASDRLFTMSTEVDNKKNVPSTGVVLRQHCEEEIRSWGFRLLLDIYSSEASVFQSHSPPSSES
jgi:hypothetical protein